MVVLNHLLAATLSTFLPNITTIPSGFFDKIAFDMDHIGRAREIAFIEETARSTYNKNGTKVNIAVWNTHIRQTHHFGDDILETGLLPMGAGGGFRVVVFTGAGYFQNGNEVAEHNWKVSGDVVVEGGVARWTAVGSCVGFWGCIKATYEGWMQQPVAVEGRNGWLDLVV